MPLRSYYRLTADKREIKNFHKLPLETSSIQKIRERYFDSQLLFLREYILANLITK
jgi:hypothetical protein